MSNDLEIFEDYPDEEVGLTWKVQASFRALHDIVEKHNLGEEVEVLYEIYAVEEKAKWEEWAKGITEKRK